MSHYVYRFFNKDREIVYVGRTSNGIEKRMNEHFTGGHLPFEYYLQVDKIDYCKLPTKSESEIVEIYLINLYKPAFNTKNKEYKPLSLKLELDFEWNPFSFVKKEDREKKKMQSRINELNKELKKVKQDRMELKNRIKDVENENQRIKEAMKLKYTQQKNVSQDSKIIQKGFDSYYVNKILKSKEFDSIIFTGEVVVSNNVKERITIRKENEAVLYYFESTKEIVPKEYLNTYGTEGFSLKLNLGLIDSMKGFIPINADEKTYEKMWKYIDDQVLKLDIA